MILNQTVYCGHCNYDTAVALKRSSHYLLFQKLFYYHSNHRDHLLWSRLSRNSHGHPKGPIFVRFHYLHHGLFIKLNSSILIFQKKLKQWPRCVGILTSWLKKKNPFMIVLKWRRPGSILRNLDLVVKKHSFKTETVWLILCSLKLINANS